MPVRLSGSLLRISVVLLLLAAAPLSGAAQQATRVAKIDGRMRNDQPLRFPTR